MCHPSSQEARISPSPQTGLWPDLPAGAKLVFHSKIMKVVQGGRTGRNKHFKQSSLQKNISGCLTLNLIVLSLKKNNCLTWGGRFMTQSFCYPDEQRCAFGTREGGSPTTDIDFRKSITNI